MAAGEPELALSIDNLTKRFGTRLAVDHLTLTVSPGEAFALVGPDAAGKTTTMRMLVGIMDPDEGRAEVLGFDTVRESEALKEHIGYMPQRFGLYDDLTVAENMAFYADIYRVDREERDAADAGTPGVFQPHPFPGPAGPQSLRGDAPEAGPGLRPHSPAPAALPGRTHLWGGPHLPAGVLGDSLRAPGHRHHHLLSTAYMDEAERAHRVGLMHHGRLLVVDTPKAIKACFQGELLEARASYLWAARRLLEQPTPWCASPWPWGTG